MFTAEDYERAESIAPYGMVEESTGSGSFSWYRNPMWGMTQIGSFPEYYLSEYGDWIIENLKDEVEDNGFDVGRHSRKVPGYDRVLLENVKIKSVKCRETSSWSRPAFTNEQCPVIQVDAIVTSDLILYQGKRMIQTEAASGFGSEHTTTSLPGLRLIHRSVYTRGRTIWTGRYWMMRCARY